MEDLLILAGIVALAVLLMYVFEYYRPLILAILLAYLSFPIYWFIASLEIDPLLRIALQIAVFMAIFGSVLYMVVSYLYRIRARAYEAKR
ncbi:MAG: hypothetical protein RMH84_03820 [Sulfolobales archaeon]|nr:hypothetical protein [Sulfolobales archaeon]MCX8208578.1 hypothetical protein [Sulfolobales archaeon]MDW8010701.1 hypothetical protein [Sulfolobales archaeon]